MAWGTVGIVGNGGNVTLGRDRIVGIVCSMWDVASQDAQWKA